ncbi:MAG TPA: hypothetical protein VGH15_11480 [Caulobacteraceae bacterium]
MTSKTLTGTYFGGYTIAAGVTTLLIKPTAKIEGLGLLAAAAVTVTNQGSIAAAYGTAGTTGAGGAGHVGATFKAAASLSNSGEIFGGGGGHGGSYAGGTGGSGPSGGAGGNGVVFNLASTMTNTGDVVGGAGGFGGTFVGYGGVGGTGGTGGIGVDLKAGGVLTNAGAVYGGDGGQGGYSDYGGYYYQTGAGGQGGGGVVFGASGSLSNRGSIRGGDGSRFSLTQQAGDGVDSASASAHLTIGNTGTIVGGHSARFGGEGVRAANATIVNSGLIAGGSISFSTNVDFGGDGILLGVGTVTNSGVISGGDSGGGDGFRRGLAGGGGVILRGRGVVANNAGMIEGGVGGQGADAYGQAPGQAGGFGGAGVDLLVGGVLTNKATILGGQGGDGGAVNTYNKPGQGGAGGVGVAAAGVTTIVNLGSIEGGAPGALGAGFQGAGGPGSAYGDGVRLAGGSVTNGSASIHTALIKGDTGVRTTGTAAVTVTNFATIAATMSYGYAVKFTSNKDVLIADSGAHFVGSVEGDGGAFVLGAGSGTIVTMGQNAQIVGDVVALVDDFASYTIAAGGNWVMQQGHFNQSVVGAHSETLAVKGGLTVTGAFSVGASGTVIASSAGALTLDLGAGSVTNYGLIETQGTARIDLVSDIANNGKLFADGGTIDVQGFVTGSGVIDIQGGTVIVGQPLDETVDFTSTTPKGELVLTQSEFYGGTIIGFSKTGATKLDLQDIAFASHPTVSYSGTTAGGTLTVTSGAIVATIKLKGNYLASTWALSSDGSGGTLVVDPTPQNTAPLVQAAASFAAPPAGAAHVNATHGVGPAAAALALVRLA